MRKVLILAIPAIAIALVVALYFSIPYYNGDRSTPPDRECKNNLRLIDGAKGEWGLEHNKTNGPIEWIDVLPYLGRLGTNSPMPRCPSGGTYTLHNLEDLPTCSVRGHALPP
jgi:hypothetical protein